ncbi:hypothetical protein O0L34_g10225 [Tuta absoluta]|nr:hypothetical protein O0L34_g10225 [Tuta absoluta]
MNRDDVMKILSERGEKAVMNYARRMMGDSYIAKKNKEQQLDQIVDKYIAESPVDHHNFTEDDSFSKVWDPQLELEQRLQKHKLGGRRIFKGERTTVKYYPFMVSVHIMGRFWCGGVIYWSDLILTSASCLQLMHNNRFFRENPRALSVRVGSNHSRIGGEVIDALEVYFNPGYIPRTLRNNIALIRLVRDIRFSYHRVPKVIRVSQNEQGVPFTAKVLLLGWGVTKTSQKLAFEPIFLQSKELPVYPNTFCKEVYGKKFITDTMFCAGTVTTGEGACDHDAGGPAILDGKLVGIISFGPTVCGFPDAPTVFTLVGAFTDWIETVNETMPGYYRARKRTTTTTEDPLIAYYASKNLMLTVTSKPKFKFIQEKLSKIELAQQNPVMLEHRIIKKVDLKETTPIESQVSYNFKF